jgi:hypothetical protein
VASKKELKPISEERFERELAALNRAYEQGHMTARVHKARYDELVKRLNQ